jgi:hypothetical protein
MTSHEPAYGKDDPRVPGGRYYCGYWGMEYTVLKRVERNGVSWFRDQWADGRATEHCTPWDPWRDRVIETPETVKEGRSS